MKPPQDELINLSINVTMRCVAKCGNCDRGIGALDWSSHPDMTPTDGKRLVAGLVKSGRRVKKIKLIGGEPTLNKDLMELVDIFLPHCKMLWIITVIPPAKLPSLPRGASYKFSRFEDKDHHAFFVSPADLGIEHHMIDDLDTCIAMTLCGYGVEPEGFIQCSVARSLLNALGRPVGPHLASEPVLEADASICRHCPISLGTKGNKKLSWHVSAGNVECPSKSFVGMSDYKVTHAAAAHVHKAADKGQVEITGYDGLLPIIDKPPGNWAEWFT